MFYVYIQPNGKKSIQWYVGANEFKKDKSEAKVFSNYEKAHRVAKAHNAYIVQV